MADDYTIICIDEAHFRRDADKRRCWSPIGKTPIVHVNGSTQNTNVYGAYTLDGKFHYKFVEKQLAITTIAFFERLRKIYRKIIFVLDRATWHTAKIVQEYVEKFKGDIQLVFFPKTSPDANPVEECWRQTRNNVTANTAFGDTELLKKALRSEWNKQKFQHKSINYLLP
ncbi:MAG: IS630 family transposase [Patescibacteria group bacterium]